MQNSIWKINYFYGSEEERNKIKNCLHNNQLPFVKFFDAKSGKPTSLIYGDIGSNGHATGRKEKDNDISVIVFF